MSAATHTPGPWEALDSMTVRGPFAMGDEEKPGFLIAQLPNYTPAEERAANARLIAMAPTMLEALVKVAGALHGASIAMREVGAPKTADKLEEMAIAALLVIKEATVVEA
jgi:hypothetical protein